MSSTHHWSHTCHIKIRPACRSIPLNVCVLLSRRSRSTTTSNPRPSPSMKLSAAHGDALHRTPADHRRGRAGPHRTPPTTPPAPAQTTAAPSPPHRFHLLHHGRHRVQRRVRHPPICGRVRGGAHRQAHHGGPQAGQALHGPRVVVQGAGTGARLERRGQRRRPACAVERAVQLPVVRGVGCGGECGASMCQCKSVTSSCCEGFGTPNLVDWQSGLVAWPQAAQTTSLRGAASDTSGTTSEHIGLRTACDQRGVIHRSRR